MSFLDDLFSFFQGLFQQSNIVINEIESVKGEVKADLDGIIQTAKDLTKSSQDFANRVKHLKRHVIRADIVFEFIDDIRTGKLRDFAVDTYNDLNADIAQTLQEVIATGKSIGLLKTQSGFIKTLLKILGIWLQIAKVVHSLRNILPVIQEVQQKIERLESVIMPQNSPRTYVTEHYRKRNA
jgi:phage-related protein